MGSFSTDIPRGDTTTDEAAHSGCPISPQASPSPNQTLLAKGEIAGFLEIDLEHKPDAIPMLLSRFRLESCDVIIGRRYFDAAQMPPLRLLSHLASWKLVDGLWSLPVGDTEAGFKFFRMNTCREVIVQYKKRLANRIDLRYAS